MCATQFIDLSTPIENNSNEPRPPGVGRPNVRVAKVSLCG